MGETKRRFCSSFLWCIPRVESNQGAIFGFPFDARTLQVLSRNLPDVSHSRMDENRREAMTEERNFG